MTVAYIDADIQRRQVAEETVDELNRCLDQLEYIQSTRGIGSMAVHKVHPSPSSHLPCMIFTVSFLAQSDK